MKKFTKSVGKYKQPRFFSEYLWDKKWLSYGCFADFPEQQLCRTQMYPALPQISAMVRFEPVLAFKSLTIILKISSFHAFKF